MAETKVDQRPRLPAKDTSVAKLQEAEFFLPELRRLDHLNGTEFRYVLNAFMAAARAAQTFARLHEKAAFDAWEKSLAPRDRDVLSVVRVARNLAVHEDGATLRTDATATYTPTPMDCRHTFHLVGLDGSLQVLPAAATCARSLALLRKRLGLA